MKLVPILRKKKTDGVKPETFNERVRAFKKKLIEIELIKTRGNKAQAARNLGIDRSNFHKMIKQYDIKL